MMKKERNKRECKDNPQVDTKRIAEIGIKLVANRQQTAKLLKSKIGSRGNTAKMLTVLPRRQCTEQWLAHVAPGVQDTSGSSLQSKKNPPKRSERVSEGREW